MPIVQASSESVSHAARILTEGGIVAFPTETVYGLGGAINQSSAIEKIFLLKGRPSSNPLIVHVHSLSQIQDIAEIPHTKAFHELTEYWPGPLTLVLPAKNHVLSTVRAGLPSIAVRIPSHPVALSLLEEVGIPIAAPSANKSEKISPTTAKHVADDLGKDLFILDGGPCECGIESTVISLLKPTPQILRPGTITAEMISKALSIPIKDIEPNLDQMQAISPGMTSKHYAPKTPLYFSDEINPDEINFEKSGRIYLSSGHSIEKDRDLFLEVRVLSEKGDLATIAHELYSALREMDSLKLQAIIIDRPKGVGIGRALLDRLSKAVKKSIKKLT